MAPRISEGSSSSSSTGSTSSTSSTSAAERAKEAERARAAERAKAEAERAKAEARRAEEARRVLQAQRNSDTVEITRGARPTTAPATAPLAAPAPLARSTGLDPARVLRSSDPTSMRAALDAELRSTSAPLASPTAPFPHETEEATDPADEPVSDERRAEITAWTESLVDDELTEYGRAYEEGERVGKALGGDSALGELTPAEQRLLLDQQLERWTEGEPNSGNAVNYNAIAATAEFAAGDESAARAVSQRYAELAIERTTGEDPYFQDQAVGGHFAAMAVTAAGTPEARRELIDALGPEDASHLVRALELSPGTATDGGSFAFGSSADVIQRVIAADQLLEATTEGAPSAATAAVVDTTFTTMGSGAYEFGVEIADTMGDALAHQWYPDDPDRAASEGDRLGGVLDTKQGRQLVVNNDLPLETRLTQLDLVRNNDTWDKDFFQQKDSAYDIPDVAFALARPIERQYRDLRGDEPQTLTGTNLDNTIGFAVGFPPQGVPENETDAQRAAREEAVANGEHSYFEGEPASEVVGPIADAIREVGGENAQVTVLPVQFASNGTGAVSLPLFRVQDKETGEDRFVDNTGRTYENFEDWRQNNKLPPGNQTFPANGHIDDVGTITTENTPETVDTFGEHVTNILDTASLVGGVIAGGAIILGSGGTLAPVVVGGAAAWQTYRSVDALNDRYQHGQSINPFTDAGARGDWLNAGAGVLSLASLGASGLASRAVSAGSRYGFAAATAASTLNFGATVADAAAAANAGHQLISRWDELSGSERASLALSVGFWGVGAGAQVRRGGNPFDLAGNRDAILYDHLDPSVRSALDEQIPGSSVAADQARAQLATSSQFRALSSADQVAFIERYAALPESARAAFDASFRTTIARPEVQRTVFELVQSNELGALPEAQRAQLLRNVATLDDAGAAAFRADWTADPAGRAGLADVVSSEVFGRLPAATQRAAIEGLEGLPPATRTVFAEQLAKHSNADDAATIASLVGTRGFGALSPGDAQNLLRYVGGSNSQLSGVARDALAAQLADPDFQSQFRSEQADTLRKFMTDQEHLGSAPLNDPLGAWPRVGSATVSAPTAVAQVPFASGPHSGMRYDVTIDGRTIPVFVSDAPLAPGQSRHSIQDITAALERMPPEARAQVNQVHVDSKPNPGDAHWAQVYNDPNFRSYMTADSTGRVLSVYPSPDLPNSAFLTGSLVHEAGHFHSQNAMGRYAATDPGWQRWRDAVAADPVAASGYGRSNFDEDFAEAYRLYNQVRGTSREAEVRALMPERFAILDQMLGGTP